MGRVASSVLACLPCKSILVSAEVDIASQPVWSAHQEDIYRTGQYQVFEGGGEEKKENKIHLLCYLSRCHICMYVHTHTQYACITVELLDSNSFIFSGYHFTYESCRFGFTDRLIHEGKQVRWCTPSQFKLVFDLVFLDGFLAQTTLQISSFSCLDCICVCMCTSEYTQLWSGRGFIGGIILHSETQNRDWSLQEFGFFSR